MRWQAFDEELQRKFWAQRAPRGSVQGIGVQWRPSRHSLPAPQLVGVHGEAQLPAEQSWPLGHWVSSRHGGGCAVGAVGAGAKSGAKQSSPTLQSRSSVQLRLPGRVVPIGSGGALGGGRWTRGSDPVAGVARSGAVGPLQATSARRIAMRMGER
jgi:hypothetical protein